MNPTAESVFTDAMRLPPDDRAGLIDRLLISLDAPIDPAVEASQVAECEDRLAAHRRGELESRPGEELFQRRAAEGPSGEAR